MAIGDFVGKFGSAGSGDGQFNSPKGIAVDDNYIYVGDGNNYRVQIFNKNSPWSFVGKFGSSGSGDGQFGVVYGIAVDSSFIYVRDFLSRIQIFNKSTYAFVGKVTLAGITSWLPLDIDSAYMYTAYPAAVCSFYSITSPYLLGGNFTASLSAINGVTVDDNFIYISNAPISNQIAIHNKTTPYALVGNFGSAGSGDGQFNQPIYMVNDNDYIYIADRVNSRIQYFGKSSPYSFMGKFGSLGSGDGQFNSPVGIAQDDNYLYITDQNNNRVQIFGGNPAFVPGARGGGGSGGGASGRRLRRRLAGRGF